MAEIINKAPGSVSRWLTEGQQHQRHTEAFGHELLRLRQAIAQLAIEQHAGKDSVRVRL